MQTKGIVRGYMCSTKALLTSTLNEAIRYHRVASCEFRLTARRGSFTSVQLHRLPAPASARLQSPAINSPENTGPCTLAGATQSGPQPCSDAEAARCDVAVVRRGDAGPPLHGAEAPGLAPPLSTAPSPEPRHGSGRSEGSLRPEFSRNGVGAGVPPVLDR